MSEKHITLNLGKSQVLNSIKPKALISVKSEFMGTREINAVDARGLWIFLESKAQFSNWIKDRIKKYNFVQGTDFITIKNPLYSPPRTEYTISIDMAKELSMVERNSKGKEARLYFIKCEKDLREMMLPKNYLEALNCLISAEERQQRLLVQLRKLQSVSDFKDTITRSARSLKVGEYAKMLSDYSGIKIGPNKLMEYFRDYGYLMTGRSKTELNQPYQSAIQKGLFEFKVEAKNNKIYYVTYITRKGQYKLRTKILKHFK